MADPRIKYDIGANVTGASDVQALASTLEDLAQTLEGDVKDGALASAAALRELSSRKGAIDSFVSLKREAQEAATNLTAAQTAAQAYGRQIGQTEQPTRSQTAQMQRLRDAVRGAKDEVTAKGQALDRARSGLSQYGLSAANVANAERTTRTELGRTREFLDAKLPAYQRAATAARASGQQQAFALKPVAAAAKEASREVVNLSGVQRTLQSTFAAAGISFGLREIGQAADAYNGLQARIKLVTGEGEEFKRSMAGVGEIARRTGGDIVETANLFQRLTQAGKDAGLATSEAVSQSLGLTESINQAIAVSGSGAEASKAAITQLIQGLQSGVLRGEEFNSVMEQAPRLARALADGLGVTTGELRKMSQAGALTTETVIGALQSQSETLKREFDSLPITIGRALTNLSNSWTTYIGESDKATGTSAAAARALSVLADNVGNLAGFLVTAGKAAAAFKLVDLAIGLNAKANAAANAARAISAEAVATGQATAATTANTAATVANAGAKRAAAAATLQHAQASNASAAASKTIGEAFNRTAATLTSFTSRVVGAAAGIGGLWLAWDVGTSVLKSAGTSLGEWVARLMGAKDGTKLLEAAERDYQNAVKAGAQIRERQNELTREAAEATFELSKANRTTIGEFDGLITKGSTAADAIAKIGKDFDLASVPGIKNAAAVLDKLSADGKLSAEQFSAAWQDALKNSDLGVFEVQARAAFAGAAREGERLAAALNASAREAIRRTGLDFDLISGGMGRAARSAINDTQAIITNLDALSQQGVDTGRALTASLSRAIDTADSEKALQSIRAQLQEVRKVLGGKVADGLLDQARQKALDLKDALDKATPGVTSLREAFKQLGIAAPEDLKRVADSNRAAWETIRRDGSQSTGVLKQAFQSYADSAIKAARAAGESQGKTTEYILSSQAAAQGLSVAFDDTGNVIVKSAAESIKAIDGIAKATDRATDSQHRLNEATKEQVSLSDQVAAARGKADAATNERRTPRDMAGNVVTQKTNTLMSMVNTLGGYGLDDETALAIAREFTDGNGRVPYMNNPGQMKYGRRNQTGGGTFDSLEVALRNAAEQQLFGAPGVPQPPRDPDTPPLPRSTSHTVNINLNGHSSTINTASAADAARLADLFKSLEHSQSAAT